MRIIAIGGEPATGKSTLVNKIRSSSLKKLEDKKFKKILCYEKSSEGIIILGKYNGGKFDGTDSLSMSVQPIAKEFVEKEKWRVIVFEGDRLFNNKFLLFLDRYDVAKIILVSDKIIKIKRHKKRDDTQPEKFLISRRTKIRNIFKKHNCIVLSNNNNVELKRNCEIISELIFCNDFVKKIEEYVYKTKGVGLNENTSFSKVAKGYGLLNEK